MSVTVTGRAGVRAEGPLVNGSRQSGQLSRTNLAFVEREELKRLVTSELLDAYEVDAEGSGINTSGATELEFAVFLDKDPEQSPAPRTVALGFPADEATSDVTRTLLEKLNVTLRTSWLRGTKEGPNPGLAEPEPIPPP